MMEKTLLSFREALIDAPRLGFCSMYPASGIIERIGQDWDWCWVDTQHGQWGAHDAIDAVRACDLAGIYSLVRVTGHDPGVIGKILDTACHAVMVPMVDSADQAAAVVRAARFAPMGNRSYGGRRPIDRHGRAYCHGEQPLVVCQIETPQALDRVDAIAGTDGVDALFFGPDDMALARGEAMDHPQPADHFLPEMRVIAEAARRHNKIAGGVFGSPQAVKQAVDMGFRLVVCSGDVRLLSQNSVTVAQSCRAALAG